MVQETAPFRQPRMLWTLSLILFGIFAVAQFLLHRAVILRSVLQDIHDTPAWKASATNDGLVWITPKPDSPRHVGWEDNWMMDWKKRHYSREQRTYCNHSDHTPYDDNLLCEIPGYIPARLLEVPPSGGTYQQPLIPRVIFTTWIDRRLGRAMYTSLLTLLLHNPEYEFILFDDEDMERFFCENVGSSKHDWAIPIFSKIPAGAMRTDIWRLLIIQKYGGVYFDSDVSALGKLPIEWGDTAVSGVGCWSHLPGGTGGLLEHWAMAYMPQHPFVNEAVAVMKNNLEHPGYLMRQDTPESNAEDSVTMRLTGPAMYQWTLHKILSAAKCKKVDESYCNALWAPEKHCHDMNAFHSFFPLGLRLFRFVNLDNTITHQVFYPSGAFEKETTQFIAYYSYDDPNNKMTEAVTSFCDIDDFNARSAVRERHWAKKVEEND
mmetsp:Transcript_15727/g.34040  ORF Transcript_15727/g.34040 Transcript_15727/m.34040 type:complete len:434 (+) Transcript_15727:1883-3184(+)